VRNDNAAAIRPARQSTIAVHARQLRELLPLALQTYSIRRRIT
jgi:hypothetical protein